MFKPDQSKQTGIEKNEGENVVAPPAVESLLYPDQPNSFWPESIKNSDKLKTEAEERRKLVVDLNSLFAKVPQADMELADALEQHLIDQSDLDRVHEGLTEILEADPGNARLILYLPFELLINASDQFKTSYMEHWRELLSTNDVRANFNDGDIIEPELRDGPLDYVVKAAHLIPELVARKFLTVFEVIGIAKNNPDTILADSIADSALVLADRGLISEKDLAELPAPKPRQKITAPKESWPEARLAWAKKAAQENHGPLPNKKPVLNRSFADQPEIISAEVAAITPALEKLERDPKLAEQLYPATILFGSRLKGYGAPEADLDLAVFIKPEVDIADRPNLQKEVNELFPTEDTKNQLVEFWLTENADGLAVRDFPNPDVRLADESWVHILFGGAWCGNKQTIKELYEKLLPNYLYSKDKKIDGRDARQIWLEELEREALQYRLMHKGYDRYFPEQGRPETAHADLIDGQSAFWDSGYRRLATQLFLQRVFLPQLEKP